MAHAALDTVRAVAPAANAPAGLLVNIDNGGTLTDICVLNGAQVWRTKTLTTPYDLSKCLFEGLRKAARAIYGDDDVQRLLLATDYIRYSTTQGTNALVERKGPRLGLITHDLAPPALQADAHAQQLYAALVGDRHVALSKPLGSEAGDTEATHAVTKLASSGANRIVIACGGAGRNAAEQALRKLLLRKFPPHMLGAVPLLYTHEVAEDPDDARRTWTALFNAFLHPAMERFLYNAEHKLRQFKTKNPLLVFRNDGHSARVARTTAVKTYSSGPRGGAEGARALAAHYGFDHLLSMDIGGTTTDVALVEGGTVRTDRHGKVEGVPTSLALCNVVSHGVGGSSIIKAAGGKLKVGPESVGGAPGPACFGLGGKEATMTDAFLVTGLLDPATFFGGEMKLDRERAAGAIRDNVGQPLGLDETAAALAMERAWVDKVASALRTFTGVRKDTTLAAFGGAGPFVVCKVADAAGISRVIIPGLAAVFSAFGIGFSDIAHHYDAPLASNDAAGLSAAKAVLLERAKRGMFAEGFELSGCELSWSLGTGERVIPFDGEKLPAGASGEVSLTLQAVKRIAHASMKGRFGGATHAAAQHGTRRTPFDGKPLDAPLYRVEDQKPGATAAGPAVLEEAFFTCRIDAGWKFEINEAGDILLAKA